MQSQKYDIEHLPTSALRSFDRNPRTHSKKQVDLICKSITEYGFTNPVLIDENSTIIAGHARVLAANQCYLKTVPCLRLVGLTEAQKKAYVIADNKLAMNAGWDESLLVDLLHELDDEGFNTELTGFDEVELDDLFTRANTGEVVEDDFDLDQAMVDLGEPIAKTGDIWQLGRHRLLVGDSTNADDIARLMDGMQADLVVTDPPYNVNYTGGTGLTIQNDNMSDEDFLDFLTAAHKQMHSALKRGGAFYIFHADSEGLNFRMAAKLAGLKVRQCLIWVKNAPVLGRQDYQWQHEPILYGHDDGELEATDAAALEAETADECQPILYGWRSGNSHRWYSDRKQKTVVYWDKPKRNKEHPTMKPVGLVGYLINNSCPTNGIVLDSFGGSGSTLIAAEQIDRSAFICEIDEKYASVIIKRYEEFTGGQAFKI